MCHLETQGLAIVGARAGRLAHFFAHVRANNTMRLRGSTGTAKTGESGEGAHRLWRGVGECHRTRRPRLGPVAAQAPPNPYLPPIDRAGYLMAPTPLAIWLGNEGLRYGLIFGELPNVSASKNEANGW
jgi:hypothetical protein